MAKEDGVSFNKSREVTTPAPPVPNPTDLYDVWLRREQEKAKEQYESGLTDPNEAARRFSREQFERRSQENRPGVFQGLLQAVAPGIFGNSRTGQPGALNPVPKSPYVDPRDAAQAGIEAGVLRGPVTKAKGESPSKEEQTPTDWLAQANALLGGGPDYGAYRTALTDQTAELNARIQAMYNQLAEQAGANQERIAGVYDTAQSGVGNVYDSATQNVADAYSSSQQQAADQLARLGIEAAAPAVINPAALSQAQAVSGLEQGRAGGLSALNRYGSTAQGFASQMGQVAQQQGTEFNSALLNSLQRQLADSLAMEAQGAYDARLRAPGLANELYQASMIGQPQELSFSDQLAMSDAAFKQAQAATDQYNQTNRIRNEYLALLLDAGYDYEEALAEVDLQYPRTVM